MIKFIRVSLCSIALCVSSNTTAFAAELQLARGWHLMRFDAPTVLRNKGTKITVEFVVNPTSRRWERVWGGKPWDKTWIAEFLKFDGQSDDVHNGGSLQILKPISVALVIFGDGMTVIDTKVLPVSHIVKKEGPKKDALAEEVLPIESNPPKTPSKTKTGEHGVGGNGG